MRSTPTVRIWLAAVVLLGLAQPALGAAKLQPIYSQDFEVPDGTSTLPDGSGIVTDNPAAGIIDGVLQMTLDGVNMTDSAFVSPELGPGLANGFEIELDFLFDNDPNTGIPYPADGFSVTLGPLPGPDDPYYPALVGEDGLHTGISFGLETWPGSGTYRFLLAGFQRGILSPGPPVDGRWHRLTVLWSPTPTGGETSLLVDGEVVFGAIATSGFRPQASDRLVLAARTGGFDQTLLVDDVAVRGDVRALRGEASCHAATLKLASTFEKKLLACASKAFKRGDGDAEGVYDRCEPPELERLEAGWGKLLERSSSKGGCGLRAPLRAADPDQPALVSVESLLRQRVRSAVQNAYAATTDAKTRATLAKLQSARSARQWRLAGRHEKRPLDDVDALAKQETTRFLDKVDRLIEKAAKRDVDVTSSLARQPGVLDATTTARRLLPEPPGQDELWLYWNFDGDSIGALNHGGGGLDFAGSTSPMPHVAGRFGSAFEFSTSDDRVVMSSLGRGRIENQLELSMCAWIYPTGPGTNGGIIINKEGEFELARFPDGTLHFAVAGPTNTWSWTPAHARTAPLDTWTHVCLVLQPPSGLLYVNNHLSFWPIAATRGDVEPSQNELRVGSRQDQSQEFEGLIDDVALWGRVIRPEEVEAMVRGGFGYPVRGPVVPF